MQSVLDVANHRYTTASSARPEIPLATNVENEGITRVCKSAKVGKIHQDKLNPGETDDPFLGVVGEVEKPWVVKVLLNETPMEFHIDTRAEVTVISDLNSTSSATQPCCPPYVSSRDQAKKPYQ